MTILLRLENLAKLFAALFAYHLLGFGWEIFALLILAPDISFAGYLAGPRTGAIIYNVFHTWLTPIAIGLFSAMGGIAVGLAVATIWAAHIAADRALGYGLKHRSGFRDTHLGTVGK